VPGMLRRLGVAITVVGALSACGDTTISDVVLSQATVSAGTSTIDARNTTKPATTAVVTPVARIVPRRKVTVSPSVITAPVVVQSVGERPVAMVPRPSPRPSPKGILVPVGAALERKVATVSTSPLADLSAPITDAPFPTGSADPRAVVGRVTTARNVDRLQRPEAEVNSFVIGERIYISVEFRGVRDGAVLGFRWKALGGCGGEYQADPQSSIRRGFFAFYIDNVKCQGVYYVDITVDGNVQTTVAFTVKHSG
jgi:hypothetical protein